MDHLTEILLSDICDWVETKFDQAPSELCGSCKQRGVCNKHNLWCMDFLRYALEDRDEGGDIE